MIRINRSVPSAWDGLLRRRDVLRIGSLGLAASLVASPVSDQAESGSKASATSVILLYLSGGVTHIDSFDPKPEAPQEIRGTLGAIATSVAGLHFNETLP